MITTHNKIKRDKAFTLAEVMLAIGIMGIGMVFAACLFPAAIKEGEKSSNAIEGAIIADNAISNVRMRIDEQMFAYSGWSYLSSGSITTQFKVLQHNSYLYYDSSGDGTIDGSDSQMTLGKDLVYPSDKDDFYTNTEDSPFIRTAVLLQQRSPSTGRNDYMIIGISCRLTAWDSNIVIEPIKLNSNYVKGEETITLDNAGDSQKFTEGSTIIYTSGNHSTVLAKVTGVDGTKISLNHMLQENVTTNGSESNYVVVIYELVDSKYIDPIMSISTVRAPLAQ